MGKDSTPEAIRLQVYLARAGVSSRRGGEDLIRAGRVAVNGKIEREMGSRVVPGRDTVAVDGAEVDLAPTEWVALHKPPGYVTTRTDRYGEKTVYDLLPAELGHLFHVGRLDRESEGLLLLTNEGPVANRLLHPRYGVTKEYLATVHGGEVSGETLRRLEGGVMLDDGEARARAAELGSPDPAGFPRIRLVLLEGRKREVRRLLSAVGHPVRRLVRERFGPLRLGDLPAGEWRRLDREEIGALRGIGRRK